MRSKFFETPYSFSEYFLKRLVDYIIAVPSAVLMMPVMLFIAAAIKLDSPGPVFFKQKRVGINGKIFEVYKFRTMQFNADESLHKNHILAYTSGKLNNNEEIKLKSDPRVTRVGKFLRATSMDELPQFINVFKSEMSLVGPRPLPVYEVEQFDLWHSQRLTVFPGITGMWQIYGRSQVSFDEQLRLDIRYIQNYSIWLDIKLIVLTLPAVLSRRGAG